jgi:hypothetical protein
MSRRVSIAIALLCAALVMPRLAAADTAKQPAWMSAQTATAAPSFLDTADKRIRDDRPPPSAEQLAGLRQLEAEVGRFTRVGDAYRDTLISLLQRQYERQRRDREETYGSQISYEEKLEDKARLDAIALFERFIEKYPSDPTTPRTRCSGSASCTSSATRSRSRKR